MTTTAEQQARDLLEGMGVDGAQQMSSGDLVPLANLIVERDRLRAAIEEAPHGDSCLWIREKALVALARSRRGQHGNVPQESQFCNCWKRAARGDKG